MHDNGSGCYVQSWQRAGRKHSGRGSHRKSFSDRDQQSDIASAGRERPRHDFGKPGKWVRERDDHCIDATSASNANSYTGADANSAPGSNSNSKPCAHSKFRSHTFACAGQFY